MIKKILFATLALFAIALHANESYLQALEQEPCNIQVMLERAISYARQEHYEHALQLYNKILHRKPYRTDVLRAKGFVLKKMHRYDEAIATYKKSLKLRPHDPKALRGISHAYLITGDFKNGWPAYEYRWQTPPAYNQEFKNYVQAHGDLHGKTVLLKGEYGLGDTMQFIRYTQLVKQMGAFIIFECQKPLVPLISLCPYIDRVIPMGSPLPHTDFTCLLMSLPLVFDTTVHTAPRNIPYLCADQTLLEKWKTKLDKKFFNVGICWQAETHSSSISDVNKHDAAKKSIPLNMLAQLSQLSGVRLYSLQKIHGLEQLHNLTDDTQVKTFGPDFDESSGPFMDSAAVMHYLDLVITIDTSVAHLAGALGVPVWVPLPYTADWRWLLDRNDSPWYPSMKLFFQPSVGNWSAVMESMEYELQRLTHNQRGNLTHEIKNNFTSHAHFCSICLPNAEHGKR